MITIAEQEGKLKLGDTIIEATAGNTGLGLALIAKMKNYKLKLVIPDKMSQEKINHLRALGVEVIITRSDVIKGHPDYYQDLAQQIAKDTGAYYINQFENPATPLAHDTTTGPEIWQQINKDVDTVVVGVGSLDWLNVDKLKRLRGWNIVLFPDTSATGLAFNKWTKIADDATKTGLLVTVSTMLEDNCTDEEKANGYDLGDYLIDRLLKISKIAESQPIESENISDNLKDMIKRNQAVQMLIDRFDAVEV